MFAERVQGKRHGEMSIVREEEYYEKENVKRSNGRYDGRIHDRMRRQQTGRDHRSSN